MVTGGVGLLMVKIDDSSAPAERCTGPVTTSVPCRVLVALSPPLLTELACRLLARTGLELVAAVDGRLPEPAGPPFDGLVHNLSSPPEVAVDFVVALAAADASGPGPPSATENDAAIDAFGALRELLDRRCSHRP